MDCSKLDDYLAGRLSNGETQAFEAHAVSCAECAKAVTRKRAVERAQSVLRRNEVARGDARPSPAPYVAPRAEVNPAKAITVESVALPPEPVGYAPVPQAAPSTPNRRPLVVAVVVILVIGGALLLWPKNEAQDEKPTPDAMIAAPPPKEPPREPVQATPPPAPEPVAPPVPTPPPTAAAPTAAPAPEKTTPAVGGPAATPDPKAPQPDLPLDTDYGTLATVVASPRCAPAINALQARVAKNGNDAKSWGLLVQCYGKRHRWKNVMSAYNHLLEVGNSELIESVQPVVNQAQAALNPAEPAGDATATPTPAPSNPE